ncbi:DUF4329 domain-containing protein [Octadecabacter sp. R77987]|uniref:DUF4329 domain-containing protein n=1 Tax=Octadecabacter sp. R77987 TaxID=3093874 RepID=UPI00366F1F1B
MKLAAFVPLILLVLAACGAPPQPVKGGGQPVSAVPGPPEAQADAFAVAFLNTIQAQSFAERRELCGFFILQPNGQITATPPRGGTFASCEMDAPRPGSGIFASYHTHGAYGPDYDNEVPSDIDLLSDWDFGLNGYVSTPGGRVWRVDFSDRNTVQVCGQGCVLVDRGFVPEDEAGIRPSYTLSQLRTRADSF